MLKRRIPLRVKLALWLGFGTGVLVLGIAGRIALQTLLLLPHLFPHAGFQPLTLVTPRPLREEVQIPIPGAPPVRAVIYRPGDGRPHPAMVFFLGLNPLPIDDPYVVQVAEGIARMGLVVALPESERLVDRQLDRSEVDELVAVFGYVERQTYVASGRTGFTGVCVGGSLALLAAADVRIRDRVAFVVAIGPYYDARSLVTSTASHTIEGPDGPEPWQPEVLTQEVVQEHLIASLARQAERDALRGHLSDGTTPSPAEIAGLSPDARAVFALLTAQDPAQAEALMRGLPEPVQENLEALSPRRVVGDLRAPVYLLDDRQDTYVPYVESRRLADALRREGHTVAYEEFQIFQHVTPGRGLDAPSFVWETARLYRYLVRIFSAVLHDS